MPAMQTTRGCTPFEISRGRDSWCWPKRVFRNLLHPHLHPQNRNLINPVELSVVLFPKYPKAYNFSATRILNISSVITLKNTRTHYKAETYLCQQNPSQSISNGSIYTNHVKLHFCLAQADNVNSKFLQCIKIMEQKKSASQ